MMLWGVRNDIGQLQVGKNVGEVVAGTKTSEGFME